MILTVFGSVLLRSQAKEHLRILTVEPVVAGSFATGNSNQLGILSTYQFSGTITKLNFLLSAS